MKKEQEHINKKVEETMAYLDKQEAVEAEPFFFTRLEARLAKQDEHIHNPGFFLFKSVQLKPIFVGIILLLNIIAVSVVISNKTTINDHTYEIANLIDSYALDQADYYLLTNEE